MLKKSKSKIKTKHSSLISLEDLYNSLDLVDFHSQEKSKIIDLRPLSHYEESHVKGAVSIPLVESMRFKDHNLFIKNLKSLIGERRNIILYDLFDHYWDGKVRSNPDTYICFQEWIVSHSEEEKKGNYLEVPNIIDKKRSASISGKNIVKRDSKFSLSFPIKGKIDEKKKSDNNNDEDIDSERITSNGSLGSSRSKEEDKLDDKEVAKSVSIEQYDDYVHQFITILNDVFKNVNIKICENGFDYWREKYWFLMQPGLAISLNQNIPSVLLDDFLYLGGSSSANSDILSYLDIKYMINCTETKREGKYVLNLELKDKSNEVISKHFDKTYSFIEKARKKKKKILIYCIAGISRSSSIAIAYFMRKNKWSMDESYDFVKSRRSMINPNGGFLRQLEEFEKTL